MNNKLSAAILAANISTIPSAEAKTSTQAAIGLNISKFTPEYLTTDASTVIYEENTNFEPCLCNLT